MLRFLHFVIWIEILLYAVLFSFLGGARGQKMPSFKPSGDNLLINFEEPGTWYAGGSSSIAILNTKWDQIEPKGLKLDINLINANIETQKVKKADSSLCRNFTLRYACSSSLSNEDAKEIGLDEYKTERGTNFLHINRPKIETFTKTPPTNCCFDGVTFIVSMNQEFADHLKAAGVTVKAYFLVLDLHQFKLQDALTKKGTRTIKEVLQKHSNYGYDETENRLFFVINPANNTAAKEDIKAMFQELYSKANGRLRAVFEFHYPKGSNLDSLQFMKSRRDKDCDAAPECFFSTEFDKDLADSLTFDVSESSIKFASTTAATPPRAIDCTPEGIEACIEECESRCNHVAKQ